MLLEITNHSNATWSLTLVRCKHYAIQQHIIHEVEAQHDLTQHKMDKDMVLYNLVQDTLCNLGGRYPATCTSWPRISNNPQVHSLSGWTTTRTRFRAMYPFTRRRRCIETISYGQILHKLLATTARSINASTKTNRGVLTLIKVTPLEQVS